MRSSMASRCPSPSSAARAMRRKATAHTGISFAVPDVGRRLSRSVVQGRALRHGAAEAAMGRFIWACSPIPTAMSSISTPPHRMADDTLRPGMSAQVPGTTGTASSADVFSSKGEVHENDPCRCGAGPHAGRCRGADHAECQPDAGAVQRPAQRCPMPTARRKARTRSPNANGTLTPSTSGTTGTNPISADATGALRDGYALFLPAATGSSACRLAADDPRRRNVRCSDRCSRNGPRGRERFLRS